jgi:hypothetical protein
MSVYALSAVHRIGRTGQDAVSFVTPEDLELVAQAISNYIPSLIAGHSAGVNARDEHTVKPWFTREMEILAPSREWREDKQNLGRSIAPEGLQDSAQG